MFKTYKNHISKYFILLAINFFSYVSGASVICGHNETLGSQDISCYQNFCILVTYMDNNQCHFKNFPVSRVVHAIEIDCDVLLPHEDNKTTCIDDTCMFVQRINTETCTVTEFQLTQSIDESLSQ